MRVISREDKIGISYVDIIKQGQLDFRIGPKIQTVWGLTEVLVFFLEGAGAAMLSASTLLGWPFMTSLGLVAMVVAILLLLGHLGHPTRAIRAITKLKVS